ncbi:hypothetical protein DKP78_19255, partial [Enterococcus faecium]
AHRAARVLDLQRDAGNRQAAELGCEAEEDAAPVDVLLVDAVVTAQCGGHRGLPFVGQEVTAMARRRDAPDAGQHLLGAVGCAPDRLDGLR